MTCNNKKQIISAVLCIKSHKHIQILDFLMARKAQNFDSVVDSDELFPSRNQASGISVKTERQTISAGQAVIANFLWPI